MNLFLALFWLICAVLLLVYEQTAGPTRFRLWHNFSYAWLMFLLVLYNLHRWWWVRSYRAKQRAAEAAERTAPLPAVPPSDSLGTRPPCGPSRRLR